MTYFDVFAGGGTGSKALTDLGFKCVGFSEIDKFAIKNYLHNLPGHQNYGDITTVDIDSIPTFDFLIGGSPCQDISIMQRAWLDNGSTTGIRGDQSSLFFYYVELLNTKQPKYFLFENVRNLIYSNNGNDLKTVLQLLGQHYNIYYDVLNTSDYGVPQTRRRLYVVGRHKKCGQWDNFKFPKSKPLSYNVYDILEEAVDDKYYLSDKMYQYVMSTGTKGYVGRPEINLEVARPLTATMHKMHRACTDNYYTTTYKPKNKTNLRRLTPFECILLQGLPSTYEQVVSDTQMYKIMGNSMSYNVIKAIILSMVSHSV